MDAVYYIDWVAHLREEDGHKTDGHRDLADAGQGHCMCCARGLWTRGREVAHQRQAPIDVADEMTMEEDSRTAGGEKGEVFDSDSELLRLASIRSFAPPSMISRGLRGWRCMNLVYLFRLGMSVSFQKVSDRTRLMKLVEFFHSRRESIRVVRLVVCHGQH